MAEIVLELVDGEGDAVTATCGDNGEVRFAWAVYANSNRWKWADIQADAHCNRWLGPLAPLIDAAFRELGVKGDG